MTDEDIENFGEYWSPQAKDHFLLVARSEDRTAPEQCLIDHKAAKTVSRIDNNQLAAEVKRMMAKAGVPITLSIPWY